MWARHAPAHTEGLYSSPCLALGSWHLRTPWQGELSPHSPDHSTPAPAHALRCRQFPHQGEEGPKSGARDPPSEHLATSPASTPGQRGSTAPPSRTEDEMSSSIWFRLLLGVCSHLLFQPSRADQVHTLAELTGAFATHPHLTSDPLLSLLILPTVLNPKLSAPELAMLFLTALCAPASVWTVLTPPPFVCLILSLAP